MKERRIQIFVALLAIAIGGFFLHFRIHPPTKSLTFFWPSLFCIFDVVVVSVLFLFKRTAVWALLINSFIAYLGIIMMADFTIFQTLTNVIKINPLNEPFSWLVMTLFPDILISFTDFILGLALYKITLED